jgi:hypothetical protein
MIVIQFSLMILLCIFSFTMGLLYERTKQEQKIATLLRRTQAPTLPESPRERLLSLVAENQRKASPPPRRKDGPYAR